MSQTPQCIVIARRTVLIAAFASVWTGLMLSTTAAESPRHDVVIYGGTSAGIAAVAREFYRRVRRLEKSSACRWAGFGLDRIHAMTSQAP